MRLQNECYCPSDCEPDDNCRVVPSVTATSGCGAGSPVAFQVARRPPAREEAFTRKPNSARVFFCWLRGVEKNMPLMTPPSPTIEATIAAANPPHGSDR